MPGLLPALTDGLVADSESGVPVPLIKVLHVRPMGGMMSALLADLLDPSLSALLTDQRAAWLNALHAPQQPALRSPSLAALLSAALLDGQLVGPRAGVVSTWLSVLLAAYLCYPAPCHYWS